jgi:hypothetical protein
MGIFNKGGRVVLKTVYCTLIGAILLCAMTIDADAEPIRFHGIGGRIGFVKPEGGGATIGFGGHADLGPFLTTLQLYPSVEFWTKNHYSEFSINGDVRYYLPMTGTTILPFIGGGICLLYMHVHDHSELDFGLDFLAGLDLPVAFGVIFVEGKFQIDGVDVFKITGGFTVPMEG